MFGLHRRQHLPLTQESVVEIFYLRREPEVRIRIDRIGVSGRSGAPSHAAAEATAAATAKSRQRVSTVRHQPRRFTAQLARYGTVDPDVVLAFGIYVALAHHPIAAHRRWYEERKEAEAVTQAAAQGIRIGRYRRHLDTADIVVEGEVRDRVVAQRPAGRVAGEGGHLWVAHVDIVAVKRPEAVVPHHLGRHLRIVRVEQRERLPGDVTRERAVGRQLDL